MSRGSTSFFQEQDLRYLELGKSPIVYNTEGDSWASFDEVHKHMVFHSPGTVSWIPFFPPRTKSPPVSIQYTGPILAAKLSVDSTHICYQISTVEIVFKCLIKNVEFPYKCQKIGSGNQIMQIIWTHSGELVLVTKMSLEFLKVTSKNAVRLVTTLPMDVTWFVYSHENRLLSVGTTPSGKVVYLYHFPPESVIKLPKFDLSISSDSYIQSNEIYISQIYDILFFIHIDPETNKVSLYQIGRDEVKLRRVINIPVGQEYACSVLDNILIIHATDSKVSMLYDLKNTLDIPVSLPSTITYQLSERVLNKVNSFPQSPSSGPPSGSDYPITPTPNIPISNPTSTRPTNFASPSSSRSISMSGPSLSGGIYGSPFSSSSLDSGAVHPSSPMASPQIYMGTSMFYLPNILVDPYMGMVFDVRVNLGELSKDISDASRMISFLLRRTNGKTYALKLLRTCVEKSLRLPEITLVFNNINKTYRSVLTDRLRESAFRQAKNPLLQKADRRTSVSANVANLFDDFIMIDNILETTEPAMPSLDEPMFAKSGDEPPKPTQKILRAEGHVENQIFIDQDDMYKHVFCHLGEMKTIDFKYLLAVCMEYVRSLMDNGLRVQHFIYQFIIDLLIQHKAFYQLHQFLQYHVISDSLPVACQLLSLEPVYKPAYQLALDMFKRLADVDTIMEALLSRKQVLAAMRFARGQKITSAIPRRILEVASSLDDPTTFFIAYKWLELRNEALRGSPNFTPEDACDEFVGLFREMFGNERAHNEPI